MERVKIYRINKKYFGYSIIFGSILVFVELIFLIKYWFFGVGGYSLLFKIVHPSIAGLGIFLLVMGLVSLKNSKYFFEWDDEEITYLLPKNKITEHIKIADIKDISITSFEITIKLADNEKKLNLANIEFAEFQKIKERLGKITL
jgi:hypothetical protein